MRKLTLLLAAGTLTAATAAVAHDTATAYSTRGACEAASAGMSNDDQDWLLATFPQFFETKGEVSSFLTRAFTCDRNESDGQYYITDHRAEVLGSEWFQRR